MPDRGMTFSAPMVRALLEGRKTQTRRVLKPQPTLGPVDEFRLMGTTKATGAGEWTAYRGRKPTFAFPDGPGCMRDWVSVPFAPGDRLWVREAWAKDDMIDTGARYYATDAIHDLRKKRSPIHMPRWASRLTLTVTDVRVQRLHEISEADARAEGMGSLTVTAPALGQSKSARDGYRDLWTALHGSGAWDLNPWIAAISFTVARRNIDSEDPDAR